MESYGCSVDACTETHSGNGQDLGELARLVGPVTGIKFEFLHDFSVAYLSQVTYNIALTY